MYQFDLKDAQKSAWKRNVSKIVFSIRPESPLDTIPVSKLLSLYLSEFGSLAPNSLQATDMRGRPFESFPEFKAEQSSNETNREEEIFFSQGKVLNPEEPEDKEKAASFTFSIKTHFNKYQDNGTVIHDVAANCNGPINVVREHVTPKALTEWMPLKLERFRFGIEQYKKQFLGSMLGLVPKVDARFYLEVSEDEIAVLCEQESQPKDSLVPLENHKALTSLSKALHASMHFDNLTLRIIEAVKQ